MRPLLLTPPGSTPLHFAAANGHEQVVQILLASGAIPDKQDKNGLTPEDLAEMSGYNEVVHTIRVWYQINGQSHTGSGSPAVEIGRSRANSMMSNQSEATEASASGSSARKGKERTSSMVSAASEKGMRLLRGSFDGKRQRNGSANNVFGHRRSDSSETGSVAPAALAMEQEGYNSELPSPIGGELSSPGGDGDTERIVSPEIPAPSSPTDVINPSPTLNPKSSRRPSLPSILEKAAHPGVAFRNAMRKVDGGQNGGAITEAAEDAQDGADEEQNPTIRGRLRPSDIKAKMDKQAILKMFKRDYSPPSRSPSPPPRKADSAPHRAQVEHDIARLRCASMDPDMVQMAMDAQVLGERLEMSAVTTSAPAAKTRFFESLPPSPSDPSHPERPAMSKLSTSSAERLDRHLSRHSTISPSPLANEWAPGDISEGSGSKETTVRRTRTETRRPHDNKGPRRMPSAPSMPSMRNQAAPLQRERQTLSHAPSMVARDGETLTTAAASRDGFDSRAIVPRLEALAPDRREPKTDAQHPRAGSPAEPAEDDAQQTHIGSSSSTIMDTPSGAAVESTPTAQSGLRNAPEVAVAEHLQPPQAEHDTSGVAASQSTGRYRGESIGSYWTDSSGGVLTPPSSRVLTPPGSRHTSVAEDDIRFLGLVPAEGNALPGIPRTSETSLSAIAAKFPPVPENGISRNMPASAPPRPPTRTISSHAEAKTAMEQAERDVLELAQIPDTASANRDLASQLAAYGETHAIAQEFALAEQKSSRTSRSSVSERTSHVSDRERRRVSSGHSTHNRSGSAHSPVIEPSWTPLSVNHIYDRREQAYRERLSALTSAAVATSTHHRIPTNSSNRRYGSVGEMWASSQSTSGLQRRVTSPSQRLNGEIPLTTSRSHRASVSSKNGPSSSGSYSASLSNTPYLNNSNGNSMASGGKPIMRSTSLTRPTKPGGLRNESRYQGLSAARSFAASAQHGGAVGRRHESEGRDGHEGRVSDDHEREYPAVANGLLVAPDHPQRKMTRKERLKSALGNLKSTVGR